MELKYKALKKETIELALDVIQQYGHLTGSSRKYYWAGGLSTLENAMSLLKKCGVIKSIDKVWEYEIKRYFEAQKKHE